MHGNAQTTKQLFSNQVIAIGFALCVLAGGAAAVIAGGVNSLPALGGSNSVERAAPVFHRPADRPRTTTDVSVQPYRPEFHRPTDRP